MLDRVAPPLPNTVFTVSLFVLRLSCASLLTVRLPDVVTFPDNVKLPPLKVRFALAPPMLFALLMERTPPEIVVPPEYVFVPVKICVPEPDIIKLFEPDPFLITPANVFVEVEGVLIVKLFDNLTTL